MAGLIGAAARMEKKSPNIAEQELGIGGTTLWKICGMDTDSSMAVSFEITSNTK